MSAGKTNLRFRQIHLDFHTSEHIANIGGNFDPDEFADTVAAAHIDSITCFARGHHGWIYYDSKVNPERVHPHLQRNLLIEQIEACHARGIRVPIYVTVQWDHFTSNHNPEWLTIAPDGRVIGTPPLEAGFYRRVAVNSPYMDFLKAHVKEIFDMMPVDGFFFDIVHPVDDMSIWTQNGMRARGLDLSDADARMRYGVEVIQTFKREMTDFVRQFSDDCTIFYNRGHIGTEHRPAVDSYTHWELESLPSGGWGYLHFPMAVRYGRTLGHDCMGMTGKFHTSWGDFHSFKNQAALEFECFQFLAQGAKCSIGDQLPPDGKIEKYVYDLIGAVYASVEEKEPWCDHVQPVVDIGVLTPEEFLIFYDHVLPPALLGLTRMLEEAAYQFDIIDTQSDFSNYKVLILPDNMRMSAETAAKLSAYLASGGKLLASYESGLALDRDEFVLDALGVTVAGDGPRALNGERVRGQNFEKADYIEYILPTEVISAGLPPTEHAMYIRGMDVQALDGAITLANVVCSYFDRTYEHFCSHRQTPSSGEVAHPGIVQNGDVIYFSSPIFTQYNQNAPRWCKQLVVNALEILLPEPVVAHDGPSTLRMTLNHQAGGNRLVLHLLHYIPERRGVDFDVIEDVIPVYNIGCTVRTGGDVQSVTLVPNGDSIDFSQDDGVVTFTVPAVNGHQMVELKLG